jgi:hypothetical protein
MEDTMKKRFLPVIICLFMFIAETNGQNYSVALIPDSLLENAYCVVRYFSDEIELTSSRHKIDKITRAVTILDKKGDENGSIRQPICPLLKFRHFVSQRQTVYLQPWGSGLY